MAILRFPVTRLNYSVPYDLRAFESSHFCDQWPNLIRLLYIARRLPATEVELIDYIYNLLLQKLIDKHVEISVLKYVLFEYSSIGSIEMINSYQLNFDTLKKEYREKEQRLKYQVKMYSSNLIRESVRLGLLDLARFYENTGQIDLAMEHYNCAASHYSEDNISKVIDIDMSIMKLLFINFQYKKALESSRAILRIINQESSSCITQAKIIAAICLINKKAYSEAIEFLNSIENQESISDFASEQDIQLYTFLTAMAEFKYNNLIHLFDSSGTMTTLVRYIEVAQCYQYLSLRKFKEAVKCLDSLERYANYDIHLANVFQDLKMKILKNFIRYAIEPYDKIHISKVLSKFDSNEQISHYLFQVLNERSNQSHYIKDDYIIAHR